MTLEQRRAADALSRVKELANQSDGFKKRYRSYVDRLAPTILMNGLGQALATETAAAGPQPQEDDKLAHHELYRSVQRWLCREDEGVYASEQDILQAITSKEESHYLRAQAEVLAWLEWHKKFCRAWFPKGEED